MWTTYQDATLGMIGIFTTILLPPPPKHVVLEKNVSACPPPAALSRTDPSPILRLANVEPLRAQRVPVCTATNQRISALLGLSAQPRTDPSPILRRAGVEMSDAPSPRV